MPQFDAMRYAAHQNAKKAAKREMVTAGLLIGGGVIVAAVAYERVSHAVGFVVFLGAVGYGGFRLLRGIYRWMRPPQF